MNSVFFVSDTNYIFVKKGMKYIFVSKRMNVYKYKHPSDSKNSRKTKKYCKKEKIAKFNFSFYFSFYFSLHCSLL